MFASLNKILGLGPAATSDMVVTVFGALVVAMLIGFLIDALGERSSFGGYANGIILAAGMLAGLVAYAQYVQPLRFAPQVTILGAALGAAVAAFLLLSFLKTRLVP